MKRTGLLLIIIISLLGCRPFKPDMFRPVPNGVPGTFSLYSTTTNTSHEVWWNHFNNKELEALITSALDKNFDLRVAYARIKKTRAAYRISTAMQFPDLGLNAGGNRQKIYSTNGSSTSESISNSFSLGLAASYELDLWGKISSQKEANLLYFKEQQSLYQTAIMTISAEIADTWIGIIAARQEIALVKQSIETNERLLSIMELRFEKARATVLDVLQQRQALAAARSYLPPLEAKEKILLNTLRLLTGKSISSKPLVFTKELPKMPEIPSVGLPADLIAKRPDIRAAGLRLKASNWEVSAARAERLPSISFSASGTYSAPDIDDVFKNWIANLAANITGPVFDAGKRKSAVVKARAVAEERLATYEKTVFTAIMEVENALINENRQKAYLTALENELEAVKLSLNEANRRYQAGQISFLTMQDLFLRLQSLNRQLITQNAVLLNYRISLYRAIGGNWGSENR